MSPQNTDERCLSHVEAVLVNLDASSNTCWWRFVLIDGAGASRMAAPGHVGGSEEEEEEDPHVVP